jgi:hypothetical protein
MAAPWPPAFAPAQPDDLIVGRRKQSAKSSTADGRNCALQMTFAGALMTARLVSYQEIAGQLDEAVNLILGESGLMVVRATDGWLPGSPSSAILNGPMFTDRYRSG